MILMHIAALEAGLLLDWLIGDPEWFPHPVRLIGAWIAFAEKWLRRRTPGRLRRMAPLLTLSTVLLSMLLTAALLWVLSLLGRWPLFAGMCLLSWTTLSCRSLALEAKNVAAALGRSLEDGRTQVARIVGRDTQTLSREEVVKAAVETVAENTTDGVISPMLYLAIGGPVLAMGFKAAATLDSMVGYLDPKYRDIGWSSARLDDILNWVPARLCALLMCLSAGIVRLDMRSAFRVVRRDHANHLSPNCAWSEAAAAGALHIQLGGTHRYFGKTVRKPAIGDADRPAEPGDILSSCRMLYAASALMALLCAAAGAAVFLIPGCT